MRATTVLVAVLLFALVGNAVSQTPAPIQANASVLGLLTKGKAISIKDCGYNYELTMYADDGVQPLGHTVIEVTAAYVVVRDLAGITDTAIPLGSIKSVATVRFKGRQ